MNAIYLFIVNRGRAWFSLAWFLWSFSPSLLIAQTKFSSLFSQDELTPMERKLLRDAEDGRFDALTLLGAYAIITGHRSTADFNHITRGYLNGKQQVIKNVSGKNNYAQSKSLLSQIHEKFLKKYSLNAIFLGELLNEGRYNCISSSLIFADCLDTLNIPRQFMVVSEHIYLNVKADGKTYPCEPTNPHGFDPGEHHLFETPEGKRGWVPKIAYQNPRPYTDTEFIAMLTADKRVLQARHHQSAESLWRLSRMGWALAPENAVLKQNMATAAIELANALLKKQDMGRLKKLLFQMVALFPDDENTMNSTLLFFSEILESELKERPTKQTLPAYFSLKPETHSQKIVEIGLAKAFESFHESGRLDEMKSILQAAREKFPSSKHLLTLNDQMTLYELHHSKSLSVILAKYKKLEAKYKKTHTGIFYPLLFSKAIKAEWVEIDKGIGLLKEELTANAWREILEALFMNLMYKEYKAKNYQKGFDSYTRSLTYLSSPKIQNNFKALCLAFLDASYQHQGLREVVRQYHLLVEKYPQERWLKTSPASILHDYFLRSIKKDKWREVLATFDELKNQFSPQPYEELTGYIFGKSLDLLIEKKEFRSAEKLGKLAFHYVSTPHLINNYLYTLIKTTELHLLQKDFVGGLDLLLSRAREFPHIDGWQSRVQVTFFQPMVDLYLQKDQQTLDQMNSRMQKFFSRQERLTFNQRIALAVTYAFIQRQAYPSAIHTAEKFYPQLKDADLAENYLYAMHKWFESMPSPNKIRAARTVFAQAKKNLSNHPKLEALKQKYSF